MKCPRAKSANHCITELFSIYQNKPWTIRRPDNHIVVPSSNRIKLKIDWFLVSEGWGTSSEKVGIRVYLFFRVLDLQKQLSFGGGWIFSPRVSFSRGFGIRVEKSNLWNSLCCAALLLFATRRPEESANQVYSSCSY